ncbi:hypothetical protein SDC9_115365 [bioreactor metagenome]|uniref:Uncharacterized protein n=1 Tax=bioreactor metagenome TaxID=1076179 RepID=A0A645BZA3_9ZZZZ
MAGKVALKEIFIDGQVLESDELRLGNLFRPIQHQHRITLRENRLDLPEPEKLSHSSHPLRLLCSMLFLRHNLFLEKSGQFNVLRMAGLDCNDRAGNAAAGEVNISDDIENLMTHDLVRVTQPFLADDRPVVDDRGRVEAAALHQTHRQQLLEVAEIDEGAPSGDFGFVRFRRRRGEFIKLRIDRTAGETGGAGDAEHRAGNDHQPGMTAFDIKRRVGRIHFRLGLLLRDASLAQHIAVRQRAAVADRRLHAVHFNDAVVDVERVQRRNNVLDGNDNRLAFSDGGAAPDVDHVRRQRPDFGFAGEVDAPENDSGVLGSGLDPDRRARAGMQRNARIYGRTGHSLLFFHRFFRFQIEFSTSCVII